MNDKPFNVIQAQCPEFYEWLKEISRNSKVVNFVVPDYKNGIKVRFYTKENRYSISIKLPEPNRDASENNNYGYLGCMVQKRKPQAGEDWNRGADLPDGKYCIETWNKIKNAIIAYELVKVAKPREHITDDSKECWCNPTVIKVKGAN